METKFTFNTNGNSNQVKYVLNTSDNQEIEFTEKDLEVLEILKELLKNVEFYKDFIIDLEWDFEEDEKIKKVKKWLENV